MISKDITIPEPTIKNIVAFITKNSSEEAWQKILGELDKYHFVTSYDEVNAKEFFMLGRESQNHQIAALREYIAQLEDSYA